MTASFPESAVLSGWWRQLLGLRPREMWVGILPVHCVDTPVRSVRPARLEAFLRHVLRAFHPDIPHSLDALERHLSIQRQVLYQILLRLAREGLIEPEWTLTERGRHALEHEEYPRTINERRALFFRATAPPRFLPLADPLAVIPASTPAGWSFDKNILEECLRQPVEWKERAGFPRDIEALDDSSPAWQSILLDRPGELAMVLVQGEAGWTAYPFAGETLQTEIPLFSLSNVDDLFPELSAEARLMEAWEKWQRTQGIAASRCEIHEHRLRVYVPAQDVETVRASTKDAWLLSGDDCMRQALQLEIVIAD